MSTVSAYPGARPFRRDESGRFFGRGDEATAVSALWLANRLTFLSGPAGIGKTSLLNAGVLPRVSLPGTELLPIGGLARGSSSPVVPPGQHTPYTLALLRSWTAHPAAPQLDPFTVDGFISQQAARHDPSVLLLAVIDQADDLFAGPASRQQHRSWFLRELANALAEPRLRLLICVRDATLPEFTSALGAGARHVLTALDPAQALQAVAGAGYFNSTAARDLVTAIRTSRITIPAGGERLEVSDLVEPSLLQAACAWLWAVLGVRSRQITPRELRRHGDIDAALSAHYGSVIKAVADDHSIAAPRLKSWLVTMFVAAAGGRLEASEGPVSTAGLPTPVARALEDTHLLRARLGQASPGSAAGARLYELISDRVIEPLRHAPQDAAPGGDPGDRLVAAERALTAGDLDLAERYARRALQAAPETDLVLHGSARSLLGNVLRTRGEPALAEEEYEKAQILFETARRREMVAPLLMAVAQTRIERGDLRGAVSKLEAAVYRAPCDTVIQTELSAAVREMAWRLPRSGGPPAVSPF